MRASISLPVAVLLAIAPACSDDGNGPSGSSAGTGGATCLDGMVCHNDTWPAP